MLSAALHGFILSFGLILPLGVQNVFVFNQGAIQPRWYLALPVVLTASICDTLLISAAVFGVSSVVFGMVWMKRSLVIAGVLFLFFMGYNTWKSKAEAKNENVTSFSPGKQIAFAASVSLLNPHAIMDTIGVIGTSAISYTGPARIFFMAACILVSWIWFFSLSVMGRMAGRLDTTGKLITIMNKISASIMWGTAIYLIHSL